MRKIGHRMIDALIDRMAMAKTPAARQLVERTARHRLAATKGGLST
jgi:hypothetical protein